MEKAVNLKFSLLNLMDVIGGRDIQTGKWKWDVLLQQYGHNLRRPPSQPLLLFIYCPQCFHLTHTLEQPCQWLRSTRNFDPATKTATSNLVCNISATEKTCYWSNKKFRFFKICHISSSPIVLVIALSKAGVRETMSNAWSAFEAPAAE